MQSFVSMLIKIFQKKHVLYSASHRERVFNAAQSITSNTCQLHVNKIKVMRRGKASFKFVTLLSNTEKGGYFQEVW